MNILFTGASSLTGFWFIQELTKAGHKVVSIFRKPLEAYTGIRRERAEQAAALSTAHIQASFGDERFMAALTAFDRWDLFCHHAAEVSHYKSPAFNVSEAFASNTRNLPQVLTALKHKGCASILLTGTVFEQNEGAGAEPTRAISPYGLSKGLTTEAFQYYALHCQMALGKFVIPNPFGPYEEERFTTFLAGTWLQGGTTHVDTPHYIRDNIPVTLLAKAYAVFASRLSGQSGFLVHRPSGYVESQGAFTRRFAEEIGQRWKVPCPFTLGTPKEFQHLSRINSEPLDWERLGWSEKAFWDQLANYYRSNHALAK